MRRAEAWASGEQVAAPAVPTPAPGVFVGPSDGPDIGPDLGPDLGADIEGELWTDYHDLVDDCWEALKPFLPEAMGEDRALISGVLWVFTTRGIWKDMPEHFGNFNTARGRVTKLRSMDLWEPFLAKAKDLGYALTKGEYLGNERLELSPESS